MRNDPQLSSSMFEMLLRAALTTRKDSSQPTKAPAPNQPPGDIVDRRDERGTPYRGDFPNPLGDGRHGCF